MINVSIARGLGLNGPRHLRLEAIWKRYAALHADKMQLHVYESPDGVHASNFNAMWAREQARPERYAILTEFDFLPGAGFLTPPLAAVEAANYVTRSPDTLQLTQWNKPGGWFIAVDKERINGRLDFTAGGQHNDAANQLADYVWQHYNLCVKLLPTRDCYPRHYGCEVGTRGEHLFWARHYNDEPFLKPAGFPLADILQKVDQATTAYERQFNVKQ